MNNKEFLARLLAKKQPIVSWVNTPLSEVELRYTADYIDIFGKYIIKDTEGNTYTSLKTAIKTAPSCAQRALDLVSATILPETAELELSFVVCESRFEVSPKERSEIGEEAADQLEEDVNSGRERTHVSLVLGGDFTAFISCYDEGSYSARLRRSMDKTGARLVCLEAADAWRVAETAVHTGKPTARVIKYEPRLLR